VHEQLFGSFVLRSKDSRFILNGKAGPKGTIQIDAEFSGFEFSQPENIEWSASASFFCYPHEIEKVASLSATEQS